MIKVFVYKNLHKDCWSVKSKHSPNYGRVVAHTNSISLIDVIFYVNEEKRQQVINEKRKNVHAGCIGTIEKIGPCSSFYYGFNHPAEPFKIASDEFIKEVTYNPYKYSTFVLKEDVNVPVHESKLVILHDNKVYCLINST